MPQIVPAIWVLSTDSHYGAAAHMRFPAFFTKAQQARLERIRQATMLFAGHHRQYFLEEERSQFEFPFVRLSSGRERRMYSSCNILRLISHKSADLLLGQAPLIRSSDQIEQSHIDALRERTSLHVALYLAALECSYHAEAFLESVLIDNESYLQAIPAHEIFPVGKPGPNWQYQAYDRFEIANVGTDDAPLWLLLVTHSLPGKITRQCYQLDDEQKVLKQIAIENWTPQTGISEEQVTGIAANTITWVPNLVQLGQPVSDYDGVIDLQDSLNAKQTQVARVLSKHSDPKLAAPESKADENGDLRTDNDVYFFRTKDEIPQYITWSSELAAAMQDRSFVLNQLLVNTETSPVLLGLKEGAAPDAYKKVRLEAFNSLTKAQRKALFWKAGIRRAVSTCLDLENTQPGTRFNRSPISVELRDGIPVDDGDQAYVQTLLKGAGLMSTQAAVEERYGGDAAAAMKELDRIAAERAEATPSVLFDEHPAPPEEDPAAAQEAESHPRPLSGVSA